MKIKTFILALFVMLGIHQTVAQDMPTKKPTTCTFGLGTPLPEMYSKYFIGQAYLNRLATNSDLNCPIANVTFEPGCRNNWHSHTGGQILVAIDGIGYYQERGKTARLLLPGDVVEIAPNVEHWHGAAPNSWFSHLTIECNPITNKNIWLEPVNDKEYLKAVAECPSTPKKCKPISVKDTIAHLDANVRINCAKRLHRHAQYRENNCTSIIPKIYCLYPLFFICLITLLSSFPLRLLSATEAL